MLKIKDNVDLKELEKFGFKYDGLTGFWKYNDNMSVSFGDEKEIVIACDDCYFDEDINECIEWLYDLQQAGLVEKVRKLTIGLKNLAMELISPDIASANGSAFRIATCFGTSSPKTSVM